VQPLALRLAFESPRPHVDAVVLLALVAPGDHHAFGHLKGDDLLFHAFEPGLHLAGSDHILPELVECHRSAPAGIVPNWICAKGGPREPSAEAWQSEVERDGTPRRR